MSYVILDEAKLAQMYVEGKSMPTIRCHFNITNGTIYRHLRAKGIEPDRKCSIPWTNQEEIDLIAGREEGLTGSELYERIPTRSSVSIKLHVQKLRLLKKIR